jgi:hypothetical protein
MYKKVLKTRKHGEKYYIKQFINANNFSLNATINIVITDNVQVEAGKKDFTSKTEIRSL